MKNEKLELGNLMENPLFTFHFSLFIFHFSFSSCILLQEKTSIPHRVNFCGLLLVKENAKLRF